MDVGQSWGLLRGDACDEQGENSSESGDNSNRCKDEPGGKSDGVKTLTSCNLEQHENSDDDANVKGFGMLDTHKHSMFRKESKERADKRKLMMRKRTEEVNDESETSMMCKVEQNDDGHKTAGKSMMGKSSKSMMGKSGQHGKSMMGKGQSGKHGKSMMMMTRKSSMLMNESDDDSDDDEPYESPETDDAFEDLWFHSV